MIQTVFLSLAICLGFASNLSAASDYEELNRLATQGEFKKIIQIVEPRTKKDPSDINAFYFAGISYINLNNDERGIEYLQRFEKLNNAIELEKKKTLEDKDAEFLLIDSLYTPAYYLLGEYYVKNSEFSKAEKNLIRAKSRYYDDRMLNFYLGLTNLNLNKFDLAHKYFHRMIELDPKEPSPYYNIAVTFAREGNSKKAIEWLRDAVKRHPDYQKEAASDKDFDSIRKTKEFQYLISQ